MFENSKMFAAEILPTSPSKKELSSVAQNFLKRAAPNMDPNVHLTIMRESSEWVEECGTVERSMDSCGPRGDLFFAIQANQARFRACYAPIEEIVIL